MLLLQDLSYAHADKTLLFHDLQLSINAQDKVALIGNNGTGKSTLLQLIAGRLQPSSGTLQLRSTPYYVPQVFGQFDHLTVATALGVAEKLAALQHILAGSTDGTDFDVLDDDWGIEERCLAALELWQMKDVALNRPLDSLSGGQKTKVFLAGMHIHTPEFVLLDEPTNHLDTYARALLYRYIDSTTATLLVVSHDRQLLNRLSKVCLLGHNGITVYGGNYDFFLARQEEERAALRDEVQHAEKSLRKAREKERETIERQQKLDARGKSKQVKSGVPTIMLNTLRNNAEKSTAKVKHLHAEKTGALASDLQALRAALPDNERMKLGFTDPGLHTGKLLFAASGINQVYDGKRLWNTALTLEIHSGERIAISGNNGSGKTTLVKHLLGQLQATEGKLYRADATHVYIDQDYSLINNSLSLYAQAAGYNDTGLLDHEIKIRLTRFLFFQEDWDKPCAALSGGERMRLALCCLTICERAPEMIVLDEPTNNLDLQNIAILTAAVAAYDGTLIVISHDKQFLEEVHIERLIQL